jgi:predicted aconitase
MEVSVEEQAMLDGEMGPGVRKAMEIVTKLGAMFGAERLVGVTSVQVAGVSYKNLGDAGLEFLTEWADQGAHACVWTTLNPAGMDLARWRELGFDENFAERQKAVIRAFARMGVSPTCTCTPYLVGNRPRMGEHVAWAESSAVSFANSVLGARTNREGGPSALAAAITGRTAAYGLHLSENRRATLRVRVRCPLRSQADLGALGYLVGRAAQNRVPFFEGLETRDESSLKALGAAMAASGAVALYHVAEVTPEAASGIDVLSPDAELLEIDDLSPGYAALTCPPVRTLGRCGGRRQGSPAQGQARDERPIDLVWIGCPHASLPEIEKVVKLLAGRRVRAALWITVARDVYAEATQSGLLEALEACGGQIVADTCVVVAPVRELGFRSMATPSAKGAYYGPTRAGLDVYYGTWEQCIEAAVAGSWPQTRC